MTVSINEAMSIIGKQAVDELVRAYHGRRLYVPGTISEDHPLALRLGHGQAILLAQAFGGEYIEVPKRLAPDIQERNRAIRAGYAAGATQTALAELYGLSRRQIINITREDTTHA